MTVVRSWWAFHWTRYVSQKRVEGVFLGKKMRSKITSIPKTRRQWQDAVDAAYGALAMDSAKQYGLVDGGPVVNVERCQFILDRGKRRGVVPAEDALERFVLSVNGG
jgi:hypothetical protein